MCGQPLDVVHVNRRDHSTTPEICDRDHEGIDRKLRSSADVAEELSSSYANSYIDRPYFHSIAPQSREYGGVSAAAADHLGKHRRHRRDRMALASRFKN